MGLAKPFHFFLFSLLPASTLAAAAPGLLREHRPTAAILNAQGGYVMEGSGQLMRKASARNDEDCTRPCMVYHGGVDRHTETVCMSEDGVCSASCTNGITCIQKPDLMIECEHTCSEWYGGNEDSAIVCQNSTDPPSMKKCAVATKCGSGETMCRQKEIPLCATQCNKYPQPYDNTPGYATPSEDSQLVCMDFTDTTDFECYGLPCTPGAGPQPTGIEVCRQKFSDCSGRCSAGSEAHHRDKTDIWELHVPGTDTIENVVCRELAADPTEPGHCSNSPTCDQNTHERCVEIDYDPAPHPDHPSVGHYSSNGN